jgi:hypothetical protein
MDDAPDAIATSRAAARVRACVRRRSSVNGMIPDPGSRIPDPSSCEDAGCAVLCDLTEALHVTHPTSGDDYLLLGSSSAPYLGRLRLERGWIQSLSAL